MRLTSLEYEQSLRVDLRIRLSVHRAFCTWCARYAHQLKLLHEACHCLDEREEQEIEGRRGEERTERTDRGKRSFPGRS